MLGWYLSLKATPRKGRSKELEEEKTLKNCKKNLFEAGPLSTNDTKQGEFTPPLSQLPGHALEKGKSSFDFSSSLTVAEVGDKDSESHKNSTFVSAPHAFIPPDISIKAAFSPPLNEVSVELNEQRPT